ncbi:fasciclin-2-like [Carassius gibelio]|uniref:fasciclin-2-like n=1 Tax=Carassius gibelio TaxID=101364 RepID=UPI002279C081|nr:fasciclin-2-like [Carassius gibelio]
MTKSMYNIHTVKVYINIKQYNYFLQAFYSAFNSLYVFILTVLPKTELTVDSKSPDFTGETANLKCVIESNHTDWRYKWYKDSAKLQSSDRYTVNTDTLTIRALTTSDEGQYTCRGQRDERPNSSQESEPINLSVNAQISFFIIPGFLLAACPYLLVTVVLLYKCSRARVKSPEAQRQSL